jgi:hypothetical protein
LNPPKGTLIRVLLAGVGVISLLIANAAPAAACACAMPNRIYQLFSATNVGYVEMVSDGYDKTKVAMRSELKLLQTFKGKLPKIVSLYQTGGCDAYFEPGKKYLLYIGPPSDKWSASSCDVEGPLTLTADEMKAMRSYANADRRGEAKFKSAWKKRQSLKEAAEAAAAQFRENQRDVHPRRSALPSKSEQAPPTGKKSVPSESRQ